jgi:hypothetical protein
MKLFKQEARINTSPRFKETDASSTSSSIKTGSDPDTEELDAFNFNFNDKLSSFDTNSKDKELHRKDGLSNGQILYNKKRTVNTETSDFAYLYYDIISTE